MTETLKNFVNASCPHWNPLGQQQVFRRLMNAFAYPGGIETISAPSGKALIGLLACLLDAETSLSDPCGLVSEHDMKLLSAVRADPETASFIVMPGNHDPDFIPRIGTLESPEYGATIILQVDQIGEGASLTLSGPGIQGSRQVSARGLSYAWLMSRAKWVQEFPLGVDFILVDEKSALAIPRTSKILNIKL